MNQNLAGCLQESCTPQQWFEFLNQKVFFWTSTKRLQTFRASYAGKRQLIIEVPTYRMVAAHRDEIRLCHINSGATRMPNHFRCFGTFTSIADFDYSSKKIPTEFTVMWAVKDIRHLASAVYEDGGGQGREVLYTNQDRSR